MKNKELIEKLSKFNPDYNIVLVDKRGYTGFIYENSIIELNSESNIHENSVIIGIGPLTFKSNIDNNENTKDNETQN